MSQWAKTPEHRANISAAKKGRGTGRDNPNWKGGVIVKSNGYVYEYSPDHPNPSHDKYVLQHRLVMERHLGRYLERGEVVHHINGDTRDNRIENLQVFGGQSEHASHHGNKT